MEWSRLAKEINDFKDKFEKSYKCINRDTTIKVDTLIYHINTLITQYNNIVDIVNRYNNRLTTEHDKQCNKLLQSLNTRLQNIGIRRNIEIFIPDDLKLHAEFNDSQLNEVNESKPTIDTESDSEIETLEESSNTDTIMSQTLVEFLKLASSLLPEFDGKAENLQSFKDALNLIDSLKCAHETSAISLIKTKLKGHARNLIGNEQTIVQIVDTLTAKVKGESVDVISAKLLNLQQKSKTANQYVHEVEKLTKSLEGAYINDGLSSDLASKYSTTLAVKAMTQNCSIDKVKLIMQAGTFSNMNDAMSKFVNSCTDSTGHSNTVLFYRQQNNRGNHRNYRGRGNNHNNGYRNTYNNNRGQGPYRGNFRGRGNSNRFHSNGNNNNVRITQSNSGNAQMPLNTQN